MTKARKLCEFILNQDIHAHGTYRRPVALLAREVAQRGGDSVDVVPILQRLSGIANATSGKVQAEFRSLERDLFRAICTAGCTTQLLLFVASKTHTAITANPFVTTAFLLFNKPAANTSFWTHPALLHAASIPNNVHSKPDHFRHAFGLSVLGFTPTEIDSMLSTVNAWQDLPLETPFLQETIAQLLHGEETLLPGVLSWISQETVPESVLAAVFSATLRKGSARALPSNIPVQTLKRCRIYVAQCFKDFVSISIVEFCQVYKVACCGGFAESLEMLVDVVLERKGALVGFIAAGLAGVAERERVVLLKELLWGGVVLLSVMVEVLCTELPTTLSLLSLKELSELSWRYTTLSEANKTLFNQIESTLRKQSATKPNRNRGKHDATSMALIQKAFDGAGIARQTDFVAKDVRQSVAKA